MWTGIGAAGTAVIGMAFLGDTVSALKLVSIGLVLAVVGLNLSGATPQARRWALADLIRRASSISTLIPTATPSASSSPAHGLSSNAWPPSRPMKNE